MVKDIVKKMVYVKSFTFNGKSKSYPYPMIREVDLRKIIERIKKRIRTEDWQEDDDVCCIINEEIFNL